MVYQGRVFKGGIDVGELGELGKLGKHGKGGELRRRWAEHHLR
jgi:hypothetical protein